MNFDDYMKKIQNISNILEKNNYAENILNSKEINIENDFQYICLSSASNYNLVNEVIARLAQNGNKNIVVYNIKNISMSMWKDLFDKNESIKKIFIENFNTIFENTTILTFREIERFANDNDTCNLIYNSLNNIIKKLCTYDRASLISMIKHNPNGIQKIKENLESFFQKGEFDITTTYSKILNELSQIPEISKMDILKACNNNLKEMLNRETAIDNETNKLLNWLYDTFEETPMSETERTIIKQNINNAILANFENILDKSNYDKRTIKILKQFDCTKEKFEKNKNHFIERSNSSNSNDKYYNLYNNKKYIVESIVNSQKINNILSNTTEQINKENIVLKNMISVKNNKIEVASYNIEDKKQMEEINHKKYVNDAHTTINNSINMTSDYLINKYIEKFNQKEQNKETEENTIKTKEEILKEQIRNLVNSNIQETDKIIDKVLKRNTQTKEQDFNMEQIEAKIINENLKNNSDSTENINTKSNLSQITTDENINTLENNTNTALIVKEESLEISKKQNLLKRLFKKIINIFKSKSSIERIGE
ncbi:MAG: hypothetical protein J6A89_05120 [Clostridia bacterium]|nr:hypothetical protein [Clostridia bacterium]